MLPLAFCDYQPFLELVVTRGEGGMKKEEDEKGRGK